MSQYDALITSEHADKPNFVATVDLAVQPSIDQQTLLSGMSGDFDPDFAIGAQLDVIGLWVGIGRRISTALVGVYFSWGIGGVGWGLGVWKGPFDPTTGLVTLNDDAYRLLLRAEISLNSWDGTTASAAAALAPLFPNNFVYIQDNFDMTISVVVSGPPLDPVSAALLTGGYLALRAETIGARYYFPSLPSGPVFGWGVDNAFLGGWADSSWGGTAPAAPSVFVTTESGIDLTTEAGVKITT